MLMRALGIIPVCAVPCLLIFAVAAHPLLTIGFSHKRATASSSLLPLGAAFTVLAATYLAVQYMLALKRTWFLIAIAAVAAVEPVVLLGLAESRRIRRRRPCRTGGRRDHRLRPRVARPPEDEPATAVNPELA